MGRLMFMAGFGMALVLSVLIFAVLLVSLSLVYFSSKLPFKPSSKPPFNQGPPQESPTD